MSVYVDPQMFSLVSSRWRWDRSCHLFADTLDELHAFAARIGLRRAWFQDGRFPHYDLNERRRAAAVKAGAIELDRAAAVAMWRENGWTRRTHVPSPSAPAAGTESHP